MHQMVNERRPIKVVTVGGSITSGSGVCDGHSWAEYMFNYLEDHYPNLTLAHVGSLYGTMATYMSVCHSMHVPPDADLIFVEYDINEPTNSDPRAQPPFENEVRKAYERLLRKFLGYANQPAVVIMHAYKWIFGLNNDPWNGNYWVGAEQQTSTIAQYYDLPQLSVKGCCYHLMAANVSGFNVDGIRRCHMDNNTHELAMFYYDEHHPHGLTGHRVMGELAIYLLESTIAQLQHEPLTLLEREWAGHAPPLPMISGNYESQVDHCFIGKAFQRTVISQAGFDWINDSQDPNKHKWGYVATVPGSELRLRLDTRISSTASKGHQDLTMLQLTYLKSYEHMGQAAITCVSGCKCERTIMDGHQDARNSQLNIFPLTASQHPECVIAITVLNETRSGEHKVKVAGVIISEEQGATYMVDPNNGRVVEHIQEVGLEGGQVMDQRQHKEDMLEGQPGRQ